MAEVGKWGFKSPVGSITHGSAMNLARAVAALNVQTKQAMFAAATKRSIKRGTWSGCAFNAAGIEENRAVSTTIQAAQVFGLPEHVVSRFIMAWDQTVRNMSEAEANELLKNLLTDSNLHEDDYEKLEPAEFKVYESMESKIAKFEQQLAEDSVPLTEEALELLCV